MAYDRQLDPRRVPRLDRRGLLRAAGLISGAAVLGAAGCSPPAEDQAESELITIPDTGANLPTGDVTLRWVDSGDAKVAFWKQFWPKYQKKHPNIKVQYDPMPWTKIQEILPLGVRNKTAHDVFPLQQDVFFPPQAVEWGWVAPLDDVIPDFAKWKAAFPEGTLLDGIHIHDGKTYSFPVASNKRYLNMLLGNAQVLDRAGVDFGDKTPQWTEFREAAKKITAAGKGRFYGALIPGDPKYLQTMILHLAHGAGRPFISGVGAGIDPKTGEYVYASDEVIAAVELLLAIKGDGSVMPGSNSMTDQEAWPRVQRGNAGLILGSAPMIARWEQEDPDFAYHVSGQPEPDGKTPVPLASNPADLGNSSWLYAGSKVKEVAGDIFSYTGSVAGQTAWSQLAGVSNPSVFPEAVKEMIDKATPGGRKAIELGQGLVDAPALLVRNPDIAKVVASRKKVTPDFGEVLQGIYLGRITDVKAALTDVKSRTEQALDAAIAAAQKGGAKVSRTDFVFPNWDPTKDYTKKDYDAL